MGIENEIREITQFYPVLGELPASVQYHLMVSSKPVSAVSGEILFDADVAIQSFILLCEGSIRVIRTTCERELLLYRVQPGQSCVISICHLLGDTRYRARAEVETPIRGISLPRPLFWEMVEQSPSFRYFILQSFSDRFTQLLGLVERVSSMRLDQRLAKLLVSRGTPVHATHVQLADELGSVREVISRILKDFEAKGLVKLERGQIRILDSESLQQMFQISDLSHRLTS